MAGLSDPKSNDQSRSFPAPSPGGAKDSEAMSNRPTPGVGGAGNDNATPEAKRAGYGYSFAKGGQGSPFGGHNQDESNQYTVKVPRGSSI